MDYTIDDTGRLFKTDNPGQTLECHEVPLDKLVEALF